MNWDELMKHSYLNYDYAKFLNENKEVNQSDLMLSYCEDSGVYSANPQINPHKKMNKDNAIMINTKNPQFF